MINVKSKKVNLIAVVAALLIIAFVLGFTGLMNIISFQKNYTETLLSGYAAVGNETVRKTEYAVKYGKPLDNFLGMEILLREIQQNLPSIIEAQIVLPDGTIAYNQRGPVADRKIRPEILQSLNFQEGEAYKHIPVGDLYNLLLPIKDRSGTWIGSLNIVFDKAVIEQRTTEYLQDLLYYFLILIVVAGLIIAWFIARVPLVTKDGQIIKKRLLAGFFLVLGIIQVMFGLINYNIFKEAYTESARENAALITGIVEKNISGVIEKGVPYSRLYDLNDYLNRILTGLPALESISIERLAEPGDAGGRGTAGTEGDYYIDLKTDSSGEKARINVTLSADFLHGKMKDIILDMATLLVVSLVLMVEIILLFVIFLKGRLRQEQREEETSPLEKDLTICRPLAFIVFFAVNMSASFVPLLMKQIYRPVGGLSQNVVLGLPISVEMLFAGIAMIVAGYIIDWAGWRRVLFTGQAFLGLGLLLAGLAQEPLLFITAKGINGIGYGLFLMSLRDFVNTSPTEEGKTRSVSALNAGMYAGITSGVVIGGMCADRTGYSQVFFIALGIILLGAVYALVFMRPSACSPEPHTSARREQGQNKTGLAVFFGDYKVLSFFLLILIPAAMCTMFLDYYFPLFAENEGISTANVSRAFMLNSLCIVYLGPVISRYAARYLGHARSIVLAGLIVVAAMVLFAYRSSLTTAFTAVILLGIADSFGLVAQNNYFIGLEAAGKIGAGKALGFYSNVKKIGQMLGPIVFGSLAFLGPGEFGLVGSLFFLCLLLFWFTRQKESRYLPAAAEGKDTQA